MPRSSPRSTTAVLLTAAALAACRSAPRAAAPADPAPPPAATAAAPAPASKGPAPADVQFMQRMIGHHAQALAMTALVPDRTTRQEIRLVAQRIEVSQQGEIAAMGRWLESRGQTVPPADPHHAHHAPGVAGEGAAGGSAAPMAGMLTEDELARLGQLRGGEFDRLFLAYMVRHHEGALAMVKEYFATPGAAQEPEIFQLASDVDADQRAEIARMRAIR